MDYKALLKKFILAAGEDGGQCQVIPVVVGIYKTVPFTDDEKNELWRLKMEAEEDGVAL